LDWIVIHTRAFRMACERTSVFALPAAPSAAEAVLTLATVSSCLQGEGEWELKDSRIRLTDFIENASESDSSSFPFAGFSTESLVRTDSTDAGINNGGVLHRPVLLACAHPSWCRRAFMAGPDADVSKSDRQYEQCAGGYGY
jgi:hypothetical protein